MWYYLTIWAYFASGGLADISSNYFCADMHPQNFVIIDQLMGMWYGIEIINHQEERHKIRQVPSCPIIHISEDANPSSTANPLHRNYNYGYNYGEGHPYGTQYPRTQQDLNRQVQAYQDRSEYDRQTTYRNYPNTRRLHHEYLGVNVEMKYLRLHWDENGESTEFHMRYNVSQAGFWISSGPENGASLDPQFSHFAGTIQVMKAVGNHLVLTFCHQLPTRQVYTIILSREATLHPVEIHGVHNLLNRQGFKTNYIKKVCSNASSSNNLGFAVAVVLVLSFGHKLLKLDLC